MWEQTIYRTAPCDTMFLHDDAQQLIEGMKTLVILTNDADDYIALQCAADVAAINKGHLKAVYFEPKIDEFAMEVGSRIAERLVSRALGLRAASVKTEVVLANNIAEGIQNVDLTQYDLVMIGTRWQRDIRQFTASYSAEPDSERSTDFPAFATIRAGIPFSGRVWSLFQHAIRRFVPQLTRDSRINLVKRVQDSSIWDFDFALLIFLSTLIAGLGLMRNSGAVVIGAMLVAPLMTPIVGIGLGLAQSNIHLLKNASRTVWLGFSTAFFLGTILGLVALLLENEITREMLDRGSPNFLDYIIALASGIAAAYALGRPNLLSALPGVVIAAALVPPIATSGIATSMGQWNLAVGALLLFATNIVAICLGTSFAFWAVGVRANKTEQQQNVPVWVRLVLTMLVIASIVLTLVMTWRAAA